MLIRKKFFDLVIKFSNHLKNQVSESFEKQIVIQSLINQNLNSQASLLSDKNNITVSLTTFGKRIDDVYLAVESIAKQTLKPNRVILWLSKDEFFNKKLPITLANLEKRGLEIKYCRDLKSYNKIIPTIKECPNDLIITIDDDIIYNFDLIEILYKNYLNDPTIIYCGSAKIMKINDRRVFDYNSWQKIEGKSDASLLNFALGFSGVLYFPGCFDDEVLNEQKLLELAPSADDVWLKAMSLINGVSVKSVKSEFAKSSSFIPLGIAQADSLSITNVIMGKNNIQLSNIFTEYNCYEVFDK
tara:strand:+ start:104 stop:1003 length:900 start_codon:yes stop_codon:yes gene_type:complete